MQVASGGYDTEWFKNYDNVTKLGRHLASTATIVDAEGMVRYFEKPWKWSGEWDEMVESEKPQNGIEPLQCDKCGLVLRDHKLLNGLSFRCPECGKTLRSAKR